MKPGRRSFLLQGSSLALAPTLSWAAPSPVPLQTRRAVTVSAPCGAVRGGVIDGVRSFKGIPFAQAPVGELRFAAPRALPPSPSTKVLNAFAFGNAPMQPDRVQPGTGHHFIGDTAQGEDCLYLNIWAPDTPGPHPVFVWVYGGSNIYGATSQPIYDGASFARQGVVCVTVAYRLGAFGFLELGGLLGEPWRGSGNNALRDQIMGLRWVRDNIAAFGGDPARVTLGGESAGGKNVSGLLAASEADGLFAQAIVQSGGGMTVHAPAEADKVAQLVLEALQQTQGPGDARSLLMGASAQALLQAQTAAVARYGHNFAFRAVVDGKFLPKSPQKLIEAGASAKVPLLIGSNHDEALLFFPQPLVAAYRKDASTDAPIGPRELTQLEVPVMEQAAARYRQAFPTQDGFTRRMRMLTAEEYWMPVVRLADAHAAAGGKTYMYRFDEVARQGLYAGYVVHASDLGYTWRNFSEPFLEMVYGRDAAVPPFADMVHGTWVAFIRDGRPHHAQLPTWTPYQPGPRAIMLLKAGESHMADDPSGQERALWDGLI